MGASGERLLLRRRMGVAVSAAAMLAVAFVWAAGAGGAAAGEDAARLDELIQRCVRAYVFVGGGSGAIISPDGYVITNAHVAGNSKRWKIRTPDGAYHYANVVGSASGTDLCLMKIDGETDLPYLPVGDSDQLETGDMVIAIGNPFALGNIDGKATVTLGVVSALHVDRPHAYDAVQTDTPINPGNSGGPLINLKGELVGVNAQIQTRFGLRQNTGVGYAISSNQVARFLPALKAAGGKQVKAGRIAGLKMDADREKPAVVKEVAEDAPIARQGLKAGDAVLSAGKAPVEKVGDFNDALARYPIGSEVTVRVRRADPPGEHEFKVTLVEHGRPYLGIKFDVKSPSSVAVDSVDADSPAAKGGLKTGDILLRIGPFPVRSRQTYYSLLYRLNPGMNVQMLVRRGNANVVVTLAVGEQD